MTFSFSLVPYYNIIIKYDSPKMSVIMLMAKFLHFYLRLVVYPVYRTIPLFTRICTFQILQDLFVAASQQKYGSTCFFLLFTEIC